MIKLENDSLKILTWTSLATWYDCIDPRTSRVKHNINTDEEIRMDTRIWNAS